MQKRKMSEQAFDVFEALQHAEHHDHVGPHRGFGGEFAGIQADVVRPALLAGADIAAAIRHQSPQCRARTEIEDVRTGGYELRGKFGTRIGLRL